MKRAVFIMFFSVLTFGAIAQEAVPALVSRSLTIGLGASSIYDSYLSPISYRGTAFDALLERIAPTEIFNREAAVQHQLGVNLQRALNPTATATDYAARLQYDFGLFLKRRLSPSFSLMAGAQADCLAGFVLNSRNGNNPATAKLHVGLNISAIASYRFNVKSLPVRLGYQTAMPVAGAMYSPEYGQSYYEISLGNRGQLVYFAHPANYLCFKNMLTADFPAGSATVRLGYLHTLYRTNLNHIVVQILSGTFCIGVSRNFFNVSAKQLNKYRYSFD
jgi:hypothetical protein